MIRWLRCWWLHYSQWQTICVYEYMGDGRYKYVCPVCAPGEKA